jgi:hypothetical protein
MEVGPLGEGVPVAMRLAFKDSWPEKREQPGWKASQQLCFLPESGRAWLLYL